VDVFKLFSQLEQLLINEMSDERMMNNRVQTELTAVDAYLRNGIPTGSITEVLSLSQINISSLTSFFIFYSSAQIDFIYSFFISL
jgi:hypothetical protein